jgi:hypothetical protein
VVPVGVVARALKGPHLPPLSKLDIQGGRQEARGPRSKKEFAFRNGNYGISEKMDVKVGHSAIAFWTEKQMYINSCLID